MVNQQILNHMEKILQILIEQYQYDIAVMSQPWMYWWALVPILVYVAFFFVKWTMLTAPLWLPIALIVGAAKR